MESTTPERITQLLARAREGDEGALDELFPWVYVVLRRLSRRERHRAGSPATLCTTELVHEAYLKLAPGTGVPWADRSHFYRVAARAMRQVLLDRARRRDVRVRREQELHFTFGRDRSRFPARWDDLIVLDRALRRLKETDDRLHTMVELRFFGGLSEAEAADVLGVSERTVRRDWTKARLLLHHELFPEPECRGEEG
jgi:RNA polymerase sigma factor (TIGR02999 family)